MIMAHDVVHVHCRGDTRRLIEIASVGPEVWVIDDPLGIAFEMQVIDGVEPHKRRKQPPVCFGQSCAHKIALISEPRV